MKQETITAKVAETGASASVTVNMPESIQEAIEMAGSEDAVLSNAIASWKITLQSAIRRGLNASESEADIASKLSSATMGTKLGGGIKDPIAAALNKFKTMSKEEQNDFLKSLKQQAVAA